MQLGKEMLGAKVRMFVAEWIRGSIHCRRTQDLMGELMDGGPSDAAADGMNDRCAIRPRGGIGECAESDDIECNGAGAKRATERERLPGCRPGAAACELRHHANSERVPVRRVELQPSVLERRVKLAPRGRLDDSEIVVRQRLAHPAADDGNRSRSQTLEEKPGMNPSIARICQLTRRRGQCGGDQGGGKTDQAPAAARFSDPL